MNHPSAGGDTTLRRDLGLLDATGIGLGAVLGAATTMLGLLLSQLLGISRMLLAMARRGDLPRRLDHVHPRHAVPDHALVLTGVYGNAS